MEAFRSGGCNILVASLVAGDGLDIPACKSIRRYQHILNEIAKVQTGTRQGQTRSSEVITILSCESALNKKEIPQPLKA